jgi:8-oxo-dGTP diphosphatase
MTEKAPCQFGEHEPGVVYRDRHCAFGVADRDGKVAVVRVERNGEGAYFDLPGGALDEGEDELNALVREFGEETGLRVAPGRLLTRADQFMTKTDGQKVNNRSGLYRAMVAGEAPDLKIEDDHSLVWLAPEEALRRLRHDSHAWAVACWLRRP